MEYRVFERISNEIKENKSVAMVTVTKSTGSSPGRQGSMMVVFEDGSTQGTVGGGRLELVATKKALECIEKGESKSFTFKLDDDKGSLHMQCGGEAELFVKVISSPNKLLIVGGGHIGLELYKLGRQLGFYTVIFDNREDYCTRERFPYADELLQGDIEEMLEKYNISNNCYIVIVTHGHKHDEVALRKVIQRDFAYVGMIGSRNKTNHVLDNLKREGINEKLLNKVYAPIGIGLGGDSPVEIAFSIMTEILLVKNKGKLEHMKDIK